MNKFEKLIVMLLLIVGTGCLISIAMKYSNNESNRYEMIYLPSGEYVNDKGYTIEHKAHLVMLDKQTGNAYSKMIDGNVSLSQRKGWRAFLTLTNFDFLY